MDVIIPIGYAFFQRNRYNHPKLQKLLTIKRKTILYLKQKWKVYEESLDKNWIIIFENMHECQALRLELESNRCPMVLQSLLKVRFTRLKHLNLQDNGILSIEQLHQVLMPELEELYLGNNKIRTIRMLRKNSWNELRYINLCNNPIVDVDWLCFFSNKQLSKITIQWQDSKVIGESMLWLAKIQNVNIEFVRAESSNRIQQDQTQFMLKKKFQQLKIWTNQGNSS